MSIPKSVCVEVSHLISGLAAAAGEVPYIIAPPFSPGFVKSFILGFDKDIKIDKHNLKQFDSLPSAQDGTLEQKLDEEFR